MKRVVTFYFSPTGTTEKVVMEIASALADKEGCGMVHHDFTLPAGREAYPDFREGDIIIAGVPVYAGRVPNVLLKYLSGLKGNGAKAVAVVLYGNRAYDDALLELRDILKHGGFNVMGAGAFIGEHSFSYDLAKGRPNEGDLELAREFASRLDFDSGYGPEDLDIYGNPDYKEYYKPLDEEGKPVDIRRVQPKTGNACIDCKICVKVCPMGSIPHGNVKILTGICIKCGACIKKCPVEAKYFDDPDYLRHKWELEEEFKDWKLPEFFV
ncbi:MAG TPA: 4Fe-4S dicluster domain-containing protein [Tissierellaceae bacterium]|nr:4Fe-4S dicluster domain-containing protein [Tissierellaceae bacterium]